MTIRVAFKKLHKDAVLPKYGTEGSAGFDFHVVEPGKLWPCERVLVKTGLAVQVPEDFELQLRPRSGLALKKGITLTNTPATIDSDYRGEIGIILEIAPQASVALLGVLRLALPTRRAALYVRAVRDHLADFGVTLPTLLDRGAEASIHAWFAGYDGVRELLYPALPQTYAQWREGDGGASRH